MFEKYIALTMALLMMSGCATMRDSLLLGAGSGIATGAAIGAITNSENSGNGALIGGIIGAAVGLTTGYLVHKGLDDRDNKTRKDTLFGLEQFGVSDVPMQSSSVPSISFRVVEEQKIETHRQGNKVIEGHHVWILSEDSNIHYNGEKNKK